MIFANKISNTFEKGFLRSSVSIETKSLNHANEWLIGDLEMSRYELNNSLMQHGR